MTLLDDLEPGLVVLRAWCANEEARLIRVRRLTLRQARQLVSAALAHELTDRLKEQRQEGL